MSRRALASSRRAPGRAGRAAVLGATLVAVALGGPREGPALREVRLTGPLETVRLDWGAAGSTRVVGPLLAGESRTLLVPAPATLAGREPTVEVDGRSAAGDPRVRLGPPIEPPDGARWAGLPRGLRARTRAPVGPDGSPGGAAGGGGGGGEWGPLSGGLGAAAWALLAGTGLLVLALRRRPVAALATGAAGAVGILAVAAPPTPAPPVRVLEGAGGSWVRVDAGYERLAIGELEALVELAAEPADLPLAWTVELAPGQSRWRVEARGARLHAVLAPAPDAPPPGALEASANGWRDLAAAWTRDERGAWSARGPWPVGAPLSPTRARGAEGGEAADSVRPPGWLASGLPQGVTVLVARVAPTSAGEPPTWLRRVGP